jgi:hypothetical protein
MTNDLMTQRQINPCNLNLIGVIIPKIGGIVFK